MPGAKHERRVVRGMRLGKHKPRKDARTLKLARYVDLKALPPHPGSLDLSKPVSSYPVLLNDSIGDCTIAGAAHMTETWTANAQGAARVQSNNQVLSAYEAVSGYRPNDPATDQGANLLDVLNYWRKTGIGGDRIDAYASVNLKNHSLVKAAIDIGGGLYTGVGLPVTAQSQVGKRWTAPAKKTGNGAPYSWGGHCANFVGYNRSGVLLVTWGILQWATWGFVDAYFDEGYFVVSPDWIEASGKSPVGLDLAGLEADAQALSAA